MPNIPSVGTSTTSFTDPGVVNVESQAYPFAPNLAQALALNLAALTAGSRFAANPPPVLSQAGPRPLEAAVAGQSFILPSLAIGVPFVDPPEVDVGVQNVVRQPVAEFVVTESGNYQFNANVPTSARKTISTVTSFTVVQSFGVTITYYVITFVAGTNLMDFGVDLVGSQAGFPNSAPARNPQNVPTGTITSFNSNQIVVDGTNLLADPPVGGDVVVLDVTRHGDDMIFDLGANESNVSIAPAPPVAVTTVADARSVVNATAGSGVLVPFVGSGARIPLLVYQDLRETAFFPASQAPVSLGLPVNVFVG